MTTCDYLIIGVEELSKMPIQDLKEHYLALLNYRRIRDEDIPENKSELLNKIMANQIGIMRREIVRGAQ
jgi:hypothetical protein